MLKLTILALLVTALGLTSCALMPVCLTSAARLAVYGTEAADAQPMATWPLYLVGALAMVAGLAVGYCLKKIIAGALLALGGAALLGWVRFLETYPWAFWIPYGICVLAVLYFAWDYWRTTKGKMEADAVNDAVIPAIEQAEPKKYGDAPSGPIKTNVLINAMAAGTADIVRKKVSEVKARASK